MGTKCRLRKSHSLPSLTSFSHQDDVFTDESHTSVLSHMSPGICAELKTTGFTRKLNLKNKISNSQVLRL